MTGWIRALALAGSFAVALAGCGVAPVTGPAPAGGGTPQLLSTAPGGLVTYVRVLDGDALSAATPSPTALTSTVSINGLLGGTLSCGRFKITVPAGAFEGLATVSMKMCDSTLAFVDLNISPATLNDFKLPVLLAFDPTDLSVADPITIYWYDSSGKDWMDLLARTDSKTGLPTVYLRHFSPYGAGKAGW